jgi:hypothetical protein
MGPKVRLKARWRLARAAVKSFLWLVAAVVLALLFVLKTGLGHRAVLGWALDQARSQVEGRIEVDRIGSANLLRGARLGGVRLLTPEGELLFASDSVEVSYRLFSLVRGDLVLSDLQLWRPELRLVQMPGEEASTLGRWIGARATAGDGGRGPTLVFDGVRIHDGRISLISPLATPADTAGLLRSDGSAPTPMRTLEAHEIEARLERLTVGEGESTFDARIATLDGVFEVLREPLRLADARGDVRLVSDTLTLELTRARVDDVTVEGDVTVQLPDEERGTDLSVNLALSGLDLARYEWLVGALPPLAGDLRVVGEWGPAGQRWRIFDLDAALDGGRVQGTATVVRNGGTGVEGVDLRLSGIPLTVFEPWLPLDSLPFGGRLDGTLRASGALAAPVVNGSFRLVPEGHPAVVGTFQGGLLLPAGASPGLRDFTLVLDSLDWELASLLAPGFRLVGPGSARVNATGDLDEGLRFDADLRHAPDEGAPSHVLASGSVRRMEGGILALDVQGDLSPLSFTALRRGYPSLPLSGEVSGAVRARGLLNALDVFAEVDTELGWLELTARLDVRDPAAGYRLEGNVREFLASGLVPALPDPSRFSGRFEIEGRGLTAADMEADAWLELDASRVAGFVVDSVRTRAHVRDGVLTLDTLTGRAAGFSLEASGTLAVDTLRPPGEIHLTFDTESLLGIRPLFMGDTVIAADTLGALEREILRLTGVDPDTLPSIEDVRMDGRARGALTLTGSVRDFTAAGEVTLEDVHYGRSTLASARVTGVAEGLPGLAGRVRLEVETGPMQAFQRSFSEGRAELDFQRPEGTFVLELSRSDEEDYRARASFEVDSLGGRVRLEELGLRFDTLAYALASPASLAWDDSAVTVRDFELIRPGDDPLSLSADGRLPRSGRADFTLTGRGLRMERLIQIAQREDLELFGRVDLDLKVEGTAAAPIIEGSFAGQDLEAKSVQLSRFSGEFSYQDRGADVTLAAWRDDLRVLRVEGRVPVDLALQSVADRTPDEDMDVRVVADSLPAVFLLTILEDLEDVRGTVSGELRLAGSLDDPEPEGVLRLRGGAWTVAALGVRQSQVEAELDVAGDGVVTVQATGRAGGGSLTVGGTVTLAPVADPGLDLTLTLDRFRGVDRRDVEGTLSGEVRLSQRFRRPVITGSLSVDEGILHLEEFQRSAGVVNLSDPRFFTYVDTSLLRGRPLLAETRNPFMDSLRVNVNLAVQRGTWLRSPQMNVEIGGSLIVTYDRAAQDIVMIGELEAVRGQYSFLSRSFDVRSGTVEFVGTPGINPNLDIQAVARVRRREADPLLITANLSGTLIDPRVRLTTDAGNIPESDLISYLVFGRPSSEVNSLFAGGGRGGGGMGDGLLGEGVSILSSTLTGSLAALAQGVGWFDYLSVSQAADVGASSGGFSPFAGTQVEVGQYFLGGDYFAAVTLRPLSGSGQSGNILGGFRLEWQASDQYHVEAFAEDRFLRGGGYGFQELGIRSSLIYGLLLFREWGY